MQGIGYITQVWYHPFAVQLLQSPLIIPSLPAVSASDISWHLFPFPFRLSCVLYLHALCFIYIASCYLCPHLLHHLPQLLSLSKIVRWYRSEASAFVCVRQRFLLVCECVLPETISAVRPFDCLWEFVTLLSGLKSLFIICLSVWGHSADILKMTHCRWKKISIKIYSWGV